MDIVQIESPYAGGTAWNLRYVRAAMRDCFLRGEIPYASHALYTQEGVLDDQDPVERSLGIQAGFKFRQFCAKTVVYTDLGISHGMEYGIAHAKAMGHPIEYRTIEGWKSPHEPGLHKQLRHLQLAK